LINSNIIRGRLKKEGDEPEAHIIEDESPGNLTGHGHGLYRKYMKWTSLFIPGAGKK
jgi:hypothetical protein